MIMKRITFTDIAKQLDVTPQYISQLANCTKRPNWKRAKQLSKITNTYPELWLEGTSQEIKSVLNEQSKAA